VSTTFSSSSWRWHSTGVATPRPGVSGPLSPLPGDPAGETSPTPAPPSFRRWADRVAHRRAAGRTACQGHSRGRRVRWWVGRPAGLHEPEDRLGAGTIDRHRAIVSIQEELEAVGWYDQRVDATVDPELAAVLAHNRDEEKEHAAMTLEWLRRHEAVLDRHLRTYLFTSDPVVGAEAEAVGPGGGTGSLGIGSLRE